MRNLFEMEPIPGIDPFVMPTKKLLDKPSPEEVALQEIKHLNKFYLINAREPAFNRTDSVEYELCEKLQRLRFHGEKFEVVKKTRYLWFISQTLPKPLF